MSICFGSIRDITDPEAELLGDAQPMYEVTVEGGRDEDEVFRFKNIRDAIEADSYYNLVRSKDDDDKAKKVESLQEKTTAPDEEEDDEEDEEEDDEEEDDEEEEDEEDGGEEQQKAAEAAAARQAQAKTPRQKRLARLKKELAWEMKK